MSYRSRHRSSSSTKQSAFSSAANTKESLTGRTSPFHTGSFFSHYSNAMLLEDTSSHFEGEDEVEYYSSSNVASTVLSPTSPTKTTGYVSIRAALPVVSPMMIPEEEQSASPNDWPRSLSSPLWKPPSSCTMAASPMTVTTAATTPTSGSASVNMNSSFNSSWSSLSSPIPSASPLPFLASPSCSSFANQSGYYREQQDLDDSTYFDFEPELDPNGLHDIPETVPETWQFDQEEEQVALKSPHNRFVPIPRDASSRELSSSSAHSRGTSPWTNADSSSGKETPTSSSTARSKKKTINNNNKNKLSVSHALAAVGAPPLYQARESPSLTIQDKATALRKPQPKAPQKKAPKTPTTGRKSPFIPKSSSNSSSTSSNNNGSGRKSPLDSKSNHEDDDLVRKTRIKTELCMHYSNGRPCPFGANCTYAHGEEELQMTRLMDLHNAGLVDMETFRTRPCLTWVMTGSCPFGKRCAAIHDPRVEGNFPSWLTHTETQGNTMDTDINVDGLFQKNLNHINMGTPFGEQFSLEHDSWADLYRRVCNLEAVASPDAWTTENNSRRRGGGSTNQSQRPKKIPPLCKLKIALMMRGNNAEWQFKYQPKHVIHGETAMILQKRAFVIKAEGEAGGNKKKKKNSNNNNNKASSSSCSASDKNSPACDYRVTEIPLKNYKSSKEDHVLVHELAFGPDSDPQVSRPVSLWFHIDEKKVVECSTTQAKRFRWKKSINTSHTPASPPVKASAFSHLESFVMLRPHDQDAYDLTTDMLEHRVAVMAKERIPQVKERFEALQEMEKAKKVLQTRFDNLVKHWKAWLWPSCRAKEVTKKTPVPPVDGKYKVPSPPPLLLTLDEEMDHLPVCDGDPSMKPDFLGSKVKNLWESFVQQKGICVEIDTHKKNPKSSQTWLCNFKRLVIFRDLESGIEQDEDRALPHIHSSNPLYTLQKKSEIEDKDGPAAQLLQNQQERCWKSILLSPEETKSELDEWSLVREHFSNSRSKKVLNIIQQK